MDLTRIEKEKKRIGGLVAFVLLLLLQLLLLGFYGNKKAGYHEDELYSYYSTNKTAGLFVEDRSWEERDEVRNDFIVLKGEKFRYDVVKKMQSWDVHPPFYYYILHTICSFFPGRFSKWFGIVINMIAFCPCSILLFFIVQLTLGEEWKEKKKGLAWLLCLFWGCSVAVISGVMFIRMYQYLTLFVLLCSWLHVRAIRKERYGVSFLLPLFLTVFLGFLTQYFYLVFHVFIGIAFCALLLSRKKWKELFWYGGTCAGGLLLAILYYPASLSHIFRGYRGTEAVSEFVSSENTWDRLSFFYQLFDQYVLNGTLTLFLLLICLLWLTRAALKKAHTNKITHVFNEIPSIEKEEKQIVGLLLFAVAGYFFVVSKTSLLLGETSNRYMLPIYGLLLFLLLYAMVCPLEQMIKGEKIKRGLSLLLLAAILGIDGFAMTSGRVFFLYEEEREIQQMIRERGEVPVVVFYNDASPDNVWRLSDELMLFPRFYLASQGNQEALTDQELLCAEHILVYVADYPDQDCLALLLKANSHVSECTEIARKGLWTLYELN